MGFESMSMRTSYEAIVIGSGFGGSVAACRLAQAGRSVVVLERGRRYDTNPFPRNWNNPTDGWLWPVGQGLFDLKHFSQMMVIEAAGLGGGSLIYANVQLRAPAEVFKQGWPAAYSREVLDPYYDLAAYMLDIRPITSQPRIPPKTGLMEDMAAAMGRSAQLNFVSRILRLISVNPRNVISTSLALSRKVADFAANATSGVIFTPRTRW